MNIYYSTSHAVFRISAIVIFPIVIFRKISYSVRSSHKWKLIKCGCFPKDDTAILCFLRFSGCYITSLNTQFDQALYYETFKSCWVIKPDLIKSCSVCLCVYCLAGRPFILNQHMKINKCYFSFNFDHALLFSAWGNIAERFHKQLMQISKCGFQYY